MNIFDSNNPISRKLLAFAVVFGVACAGVFAFTIYSDWKNSALDRKHQQSTSELRVIAHKIAAQAKEAVDGKEHAFKELSESKRVFSEKFQELASGSESFKSLPSILEGEQKMLGDKWKNVQADVEKILMHKEQILLVNDVSEKMERSLLTVNREHERLSSYVAKASVTVNQAMLIHQQNFIAHKVSADLNKLLSGDASQDGFTKELKSDVQIFNRNVDALLKGSSKLKVGKITNTTAVGSIKQINSEFDVITL